MNNVPIAWNCIVLLVRMAAHQSSGIVVKVIGMTLEQTPREISVL